MSLAHLLARTRTSVAFFCIVWSIVAAPHAQAPSAPRSDLDAFMEKVLARRELNRTTLSQYVLDETEMFEILGPGRVPLHRMKRDFTWYVRDGMHVRSPVRMNGVGVGSEDRDKYEQDWIRREKSRQERAAKKQPESGSVSVSPGGVHVETGGIPIPSEPRFISEAYFMDFKFEPGNYYLAGREQLEGHDVLRIEYYPTDLFSDSDDERRARQEERDRRSKKEQELEQKIERQMNKTALVTLWVDPTNHQIVKYTFDNVWMDFLPGGWLVRVDDLRASMTMGQPFPGVWLPRDINIHAGITLANGSFEAAYGRDFREYREAQVKSTIRIPKKQTEPDEPDDDPGGHGPFAPGPDGRRTPRDTGRQTEIIREVRVHGNAFVADADVMRLAAVKVGDQLTDSTIDSITERLKDSGHFESVDVRKRYRSIDDPTDVAIVLVVHEKPGVRSIDQASAKPGPMRRFTSRLMFLPILGYNDGYGFTYGARVSTVDLLGFGERLSVPGSWGGTKRIALEFERPFRSGPLTRITSSIALWNRDNPHYEPVEEEYSIAEQRVEFKLGAQREFARVFRVGVEGTSSSVEFLELDEQVWTFGANAAVDTRIDPAFPSNAVLLQAGWSALNVEGQPSVNRYTADARGYLRVIGQAVVALRAQYFTADAALPPYERWLLGGSPTLRGFHPGEFTGDSMVVTGTELRVPITSVMSAARLGVVLLYDAAKIAEHGAKLADARWEQGAGGGVFIIAPMVRLNFDVVHGIHAGTRFHFTTGFAF